MSPSLAQLYAENRLLVFGHRGAKDDAPMNTLPAFELALQQGADGVELDVQLTKDGYPVIVHDFTIDHTTNGSGQVADKTLAELRELDAGSWFGEAFRGTRIPTLDEVFEAVGQHLIINVEIKSKSLKSTGCEQVVANRIAQFSLQSRVLVSSFDPLALRRFCRIMPEVPIGFLYAETSPRWLSILMLGFKYEARHPHYSMVDADFMTNAKTHGYHVHTWTVNDIEEARKMRDLGVEILITDRPGVIRQALYG
ncbi:MAG: glycerophosphodiester phosphodiesterase [Anaerolineaceae bacterium]|nr:glycerophosphodiester phosphodiesterase [Anaerolineaceae bacterium]